MSNPNPVSTSWKPGQSGNPKGRPKKEWTWASLVREAMDEEDETGQPVKKGVSRALAIKALTGDVQAIREIGNRIDGMPPQSTDLTSGGDKIERVDIVTLLEKAYGTNSRTPEMSADS
ncbi:MAG: hypothetical protein GY861_03125 [bacterium]|nr:hypothetical protein [bacterium]